MAGSWIMDRFLFGKTRSQPPLPLDGWLSVVCGFFPRTGRSEICPGLQRVENLTFTIVISNKLLCQNMVKVICSNNGSFEFATILRPNPMFESTLLSFYWWANWAISRDIFIRLFLLWNAAGMKGIEVGSGFFPTAYFTHKSSFYQPGQIWPSMRD